MRGIRLERSVHVGEAQILEAGCGAEYTSEEDGDQTARRAIHLGSSVDCVSTARR
jgi:hypothetical protein